MSEFGPPLRVLGLSRSFLMGVAGALVAVVAYWKMKSLPFTLALMVSGLVTVGSMWIFVTALYSWPE